MNVDGTNIKLLDSRTARGRPGEETAFWYDNERIVFISALYGERAIYIMNDDGTNRLKITNPVDSPLFLFPFPGSEWIYWKSGTDAGLNVFLRGNFQTRIGGSDRISMKISEFKLSQRGDLLLHCCFHINKLDGSTVARIDIAGRTTGRVYEISWSPDGKTVVFTTKANEGWKMYVWSLSTSSFTKVPDELLSDQYFFLGPWSPDGKILMIVYYKKPPNAINFDTMEQVSILNAVDWIDWEQVGHLLPVWVP
jgi:Tol biopolymer transport system component